MKTDKARASCHSDRPVHAHGLCKICYQKEYRKKYPDKIKHYNEGYRKDNPDKTKEWWKAAYRRRKENGDKYYWQNKEKIKDTKLKRNFGISLKQYAEILEKQNGVCAICGKLNLNLNALHVDHDHETKNVRGLLCSKCNTALGLLHGDINIFNSAIKYIEGWKT